MTNLIFLGVLNLFVPLTQANPLFLGYADELAAKLDELLPSCILKMGVSRAAPEL